MNRTYTKNMLADGSSQYVETREDGHQRIVDKNHQSLVAHVAAGGEVRLVPYVVPPLPDIALLKLDKRAAINAIRDEIEFNIFVDSHGHAYNVDRDSRARITGAVTMAAFIPAGFEWTDADNVQRPHTGQTMVALAGEIMAWTGAVHAVSVGKKAALMALTTHEEVEAYEVNAGWA